MMLIVTREAIRRSRTASKAASVMPKTWMQLLSPASPKVQLPINPQLFHPTTSSPAYPTVTAVNS